MPPFGDMTAGDVKVAVSDAVTFGPGLSLLCGDGFDATSQNLADKSKQGLLPEHVLVATVQDQVRGAIATQPAEGGVGWIWSPAVAGFASDSTEASVLSRTLIQAAVAQLTRAGCRLVQALLTPSDPRRFDFEASGFLYLTDMICMECSQLSHAETGSVVAELEFVSFDRSTEHEFEAVIEQTYQGSLDCSELDGIRSVAETLQGYRASGSFRPELWLLARQRGVFVGCVLLAFFPEEDRCELQYMGIVPQARGRQLGRVLCARALRDARQIGASRVCLSVDARNHPAIRQYGTLGFVETERRRVYILKVDLVRAQSYPQFEKRIL